MKTWRLHNILIVGVLSSWFLGFLVLLIQSISGLDISPIIWAIPIGEVLLLFQKFEFDKAGNESKLAWAEKLFLAANLITFIFAFGSFLVTFSSYWLAKDIKYVALAMGVPSLIVLICWFVRKKSAAT